ncbi:MAG: Fe-S cluster assembly protein SufD [Actinobacteria bacterium]|nr:Fe-S cluster assembly protein SufD [Actinomycetota bacterium]
MTALTADHAAALGGPDWLAARRTAAVARFATTPAPATDLEMWRYSRIDRVALDTLQAAGPAPEGDAAALAASVAALDPVATIVLVDGRLAHCDVDQAWVSKGLVVGRHAEVVADGAHFAALEADEELDRFALANVAFGTDAVLVHVPRGLDVDRPVVVVEWSEGVATVGFPRITVVAEDGAAVAVLEVQRSAPSAPLTVPAVDLVAGRDARLQFLTLQDLDPATDAVGTLVARAGQQATVRVGVAAFGGRYARQRLDARLDAPGATVDLVAVSFGDGDQMVDFRTCQDHRAPDCTSDLLFKGVVDGRAHSVYSGLIRVRPGAKGTNAYQTNRNIKLSDDAWAESVPNLEIENNDVRCSHASTVGPIDDDQRFYLESRGVPPEAAEQLVVTGFFDEVLDKLPVVGAADHVRSRVADKLARSAGA